MLICSNLPPTEADGKLPSNAPLNRVLDCVGLYCPEPVFRTRLELDAMAAGDVLEVLADDPAAEEDIKSLIKRLGHRLIKIEREDDALRFTIQKVR
jgi:tRNA 2-thiouridine synthesizing protein A